MEIKINNKPAGITLEKEKTVGEVLTGIFEWLENTEEAAGYSLSGIEIDGKIYGSLSLEKAFTLPLAGISTINIKASSAVELLLEALVELRTGLELYEKETAEEQKKFRETWETSAPALFLKSREKDVYNVLQKTLADSASAASVSPAAAVLFISERIHEIEDPAGEMKKLSPLAEECAKRLEDLPLDMQTGKDLRAAETITIFSSLMEKIFRLIFLFKYYNADIESMELSSMNGGEKQSLKDFINEFSAAIKELISAFENKDTVLVGDLSEYELAPRLRCLVDVLSNGNVRLQS